MNKTTKSKKLSQAAGARNIAAEFDLTAYPAKVQLPVKQEQAFNTRFPFFASGMKFVCASSEVKPTCYGPFEGKHNVKLTGKRLGLTRPSLEEVSAACKRAGGAMEAGYLKPIRAGKIDLAFLSPAQAKKLATLPGPNVRLCVRDDEKGYLVPVTTPEQAQQLQADFAKCTGGNKKKMPACALKLARQTTKQVSPPLGSLQSGSLLSGIFSRW